MLNIFEFKDYREFLQSLVKIREEKGFTQAELAKAMNCQAAYFSQVLKGKAELTEDHGIKLCLFLEFSEFETDYFLLILRLGRAGTTTLGSYLEKTRKKLVEAHQEVDPRISSGKRKEANEANVYYCSSWIPAVLHAGTSCEAYQTSTAIAQRFHLEKSEVEYHLQSLEKYGLVKFEKGKWTFQGGSIHFPKKSALDQSFQINRRMHALNSLPKRKNDDIHYSMVLPINSKTAKKLRELFISTIEKVHKESEPSPSEEVYSLCLDFFQA